MYSVGGGDDAYGKRRIPLADDQQAAHKVDEQRADLAEDPHHDHKPLAAAPFLQGDLGGLVVDFNKLQNVRAVTRPQSKPEPQTMQ